MPAPLLLTPFDTTLYTAKRRPVAHSCACGHREMLVPPCGKGEMVWTCPCGTRYRMTFAGEGGACTESVFKAV